MKGRIVAAVSVIGAAGCTGGEIAPEASAVREPVASYLSDDLMSVTVEIPGTPDRAAVRALTDCAAAEAARLQGDSFLRHVRTTTAAEGGISRADAVYSVSRQLPAGAFVLDAEIVAETCRETGQSGG